MKKEPKNMFRHYLTRPVFADHDLTMNPTKPP